MRSYGTTPGRPEEYRRPGEKAVKPRDAATLIIVKQAKEPKILLGKRSMKHKFMPGKFVFPGGRLDYVDQRIRLSNTGEGVPKYHVKKFGRFGLQNL